MGMDALGCIAIVVVVWAASGAVGYWFCTHDAGTPPEDFEK